SATNLVNGFVDGNVTIYDDLYLYDRLADQSVLVSHQSGSATTSSNGGAAGHWPNLSDDGRYVVYPSNSTDLVPGFVDNNGAVVTVGPDLGYDVFRYDRLTGTNQLVRGAFGAPNATGNRGSYYNSINGDGNVIAFTSGASNIVSGVTDTNGQAD